jgi:hypothetical protein
MPVRGGKIKLKRVSTLPLTGFPYLAGTSLEKESKLIK